MKNKVVIITGGAKRLGKSIAIDLAKDGFDIVINYLNSKDDAIKTQTEINQIGKQCLTICADITKEKEIKKLISIVLKKFGKIDLLVNNAGIFQQKNIFETTEKNWEKTFDINLKSAFLLSKEIGKVFIQQKKGQIINIASLGGIMVWKNYFSYSISKSALIHLTKILALELSPFIQVNAIAPGIIIFNEQEKKLYKHLLNTIPQKKFATPNDISSLVVYLSKFNHITGQIIAVDGGKSLR